MQFWDRKIPEINCHFRARRRVSTNGNPRGKLTPDGKNCAWLVTSKWINIKHRESVQVNRHGKIFTRLIREIKVATRMGGGGESCALYLPEVLSKTVFSGHLNCGAGVPDA